MNESGIHPTGEKILVKPIKTERKTDGGIIIPDSSADKYDLAQIKAMIVETGPIAFEREVYFEKTYGTLTMTPRGGDIVAIAKYAGYLLKGKDGQDYRIVNDGDITAILEDDWDTKHVG